MNSEVPAQLPAINEVNQPVVPEVQSGGLQDGQPANFIRRNLNKIMIGSAVVSAGALALSDNALQRTQQAVNNTSPAVLGTYGAANAVYLGGAALMLAGAGKKVNFKNLRHFGHEARQLVGRAGTSMLVKAGLITNTVGAVSGAAVASYAIVETLPPSGWGLLAVPAVDLYSTYFLRKPLYNMIKKSNAAHN